MENSPIGLVQNDLKPLIRLGLDTSIATLTSRLDTLVENRLYESTVSSGHLKHLSIQVQLRKEPYIVHVQSSIDTILDSGWIYQPLTYGVGHNVSINVSFNIVLEKHILKGRIQRHSSCNPCPHCDIRICHRVSHLGHKAKRWWRADTCLLF